MANHPLDDISVKGARLHVPRSRGAFSGALLFLLGLWGALVPLLGPIVNFGYTPDKTWHFSSGRFWLEILPGVVTAVGGLLLVIAADRITASFGAWLAIAGGAWFVVGLTVRSLFHLGAIGAPMHTSNLGKTLETLLLFTGLGAVILLIAGVALGRLGVISVGDVRAAHRRAVDDAPVVDNDREKAERERADKAERALADRDRADKERAEKELAERTKSDHERADRDAAISAARLDTAVAQPTAPDLGRNPGGQSGSGSAGGATRVGSPNE